MKKTLFLFALVVTIIIQAYGQDSLIINNLEGNRYEFTYKDSEGFAGAGWDLILNRAAESQYTMIGEIHGINEIPIFLKALAEEIKFETFVAEIDPYLSKIIQEKVGNLSDTELQNWQQESAGNLSFYSYRQDFELIKAFHSAGIRMIGIDQITALNDAPVFSHLAELTLEDKKRQMYLKMALDSRQMLEQVGKESKNAPYLMSGQFDADMKELKGFGLNSYEKDVLEMLEYSRGIYTSGDGHQKRIKLMKNQLMSQYDSALKNKKALFRLGANHSTKGESLMTIYDIGNLGHNLAESQFNTSYHIAIFANEGYAGHPLKGLPDTEVKLPKELSFLIPLADGEKWTYFDFIQLRKEIEGGKIRVESGFLKRMIRGYDGLVLIPTATAGEHF